MDSSLIFICASKLLKEGGQGVRFPLTADGADATGFVIRYQGQVRAYLNRCAHMALELDWNQNEFFDESGQFLVCATHGAMYTPDQGHCAGGPCRGYGLQHLVVVEQNNQVFWQPDHNFQPALA